jgi:phosphoribosylaminoimidazolecarboxamide formyltransferase/IMP cyclohydrolase
MGQVDRVTACRLAVERLKAFLASEAGEAVRAAPRFAASDAFFPFPDGPRLLIEAGVRCLIHPGGSKRDQETFDVCNERGVTCLLTGVRHFRH